jgi:hypothetical protein
MSHNALIDVWRLYTEWYRALSFSDRVTAVGAYVYGMIKHYHHKLAEVDANFGSYTSSNGNYT